MNWKPVLLRDYKTQLRVHYWSSTPIPLMLNLLEKNSSKMVRWISQRQFNIQIIIIRIGPRSEHILPDRERGRWRGLWFQFVGRCFRCKSKGTFQEFRWIENRFCFALASWSWARNYSDSHPDVYWKEKPESKEVWFTYGGRLHFPVGTTEL